jgi:hypothetical protein
MPTRATSTASSPPPASIATGAEPTAVDFRALIADTRRRMSTRAPARFAVIMAGGAGTRFWPLSRAARPKQFLRLTGRGTMLQETARRLRGVVPRRNVLVVAPPPHAPLVRAQLPWLARGNLIVEPAPRGTAACLALVADHVARRAPTAALVVLAADHAIEDVAALRACLHRAFEVADDGWLVTFGVPPTGPETGYGYVRVGAPIERRRPRVSRVRRFIENRPAPCETSRRERGLPVELRDVRVARGRLSRRRRPPCAAHRGGDGGVRGSRRSRRAAGVLYPADRACRRRGARAVAPHRRRRCDLRLERRRQLGGDGCALGYGCGRECDARAGGVAGLPADDRPRRHATGRRAGCRGSRHRRYPDALLVCPRGRAQDVRRVVNALAQGIDETAHLS